ATTDAEAAGLRNLLLDLEVAGLAFRRLAVLRRQETDGGVHIVARVGVTARRPVDARRVHDLALLVAVRYPDRGVQVEAVAGVEERVIGLAPARSRPGHAAVPRGERSEAHDGTGGRRGQPVGDHDRPLVDARAGI